MSGDLLAELRGPLLDALAERDAEIERRVRWEIAAELARVGFLRAATHVAQGVARGGAA